MFEFEEKNHEFDKRFINLETFQVFKFFHKTRKSLWIQKIQWFRKFMNLEKTNSENFIEFAKINHLFWKNNNSQGSTYPLVFLCKISIFPEFDCYLFPAVPPPFFPPGGAHRPSCPLFFVSFLRPSFFICSFIRYTNRISFFVEFGLQIILSF